MLDINDHRRHTEEAARRAAAEKEIKDQEPLQQAPVDADKMTGDDKLDKLIRACQHRVNETLNFCANLSAQGMGAWKDEDYRKIQIIYGAHQGMVKAFQEIPEIAQKIVVESKRVS